MQEQLILLGILLIFIGIVLIFLGAVLGSRENVRSEWGFFGLIGPIPFGVWKSEKAFILTLTIFIISLIILILMKVVKWL